MSGLDQSEVVCRVYVALDHLLEKDGYLLETDANERCITHKFAEYLQLVFPGWDVDCEYNRDGHEPKRLPRQTRTVRSDNEHARTVFPDIIVHHRETRDNLLVIEAKKSSNPRGDDGDRGKLRGIKSEFGYSFALFVRFPTGGGHGTPTLEWI
jgi:hypothetical protein